MRHRVTKQIRPLTQQAPQLLGIGTLSLVLLLSMGQSLQAERSIEREQQHRTVAKALNTHRSTATSEGHSDAAYAITPERRALLNTIRYAEGTWTNGEDKGYRTLYGGGRFQDLSRHPEKVVVKRYSSAAAGAYQFLPTTWKGLAKELRLNSFEPKHQDQAALHLVKRRGALKEIDSRGLTTRAMAQLAPEWASFPMHSGRSAYGQPVKSHQELSRFYANNLRQLRSQLET